MSVAARVKRKRSPSRFRQFLAAMQLLVLSAFAVGLVFTAVTIWNLSTILPQGAGAIGDLNPIESTRIISADGQELATVFMDENRVYVPLDKIPKHLKNATIATEDKRFYDHNGVDFRGIARALYEDIRTQKRAQGGSTITQQLVRNVYLTKRKSIGRKIQEALLAVQIERRYSKDEILEKYLNQVFYGSGSYGVQAAARTYFGKKIGDLTLAESALLAGLPQRPSGYSPYRNKELAKNRRDTVLALMAQEGYITEKEKKKAQAQPIETAFNRPSGARVRRAPYFVDYVLEDLIDRYGANTVYKGGLRVYTTLHVGMQAVADKAVKKGVAGMKDQNVSQGALVSIDPRNGYIRAMVGGVDYRKSQLNRAYLDKHPRSPGSTFKAFVYTAAFETGKEPDDTIVDAPISIDDGSEERWEPRNYDDEWKGTLSIRKAVAQSRNIPAIKTLQDIGVQKVINVAHRLGIKSPLGKNLSMALGTSGVTMVELAAAYGVFANDGILAEPIAITKITDRDGKVIEENKPQVKRVLKPEIHKKIDSCLLAVTQPGGTAVRVGRTIEKSRGKTGTAQEDRDAWFAGYVPKELVTVVWVGNDDNSQMRKVFGGSNCGPIWTEFMEKALKMNPDIKPPKPGSGNAVKQAKTEKAEKKEKEEAKRRDREPEAEPRTAERRPEREESTDSGKVELRLCADTGLPATEQCPSTYFQNFSRTNLPKEPCILHPGESANDLPEVRSTRAEPERRRERREPALVSSERTSEFEGLRRDRAGDEPAVELREEPEEQPVRFSLCLESGDRATRYCTDTIQRRLLPSQAPGGFCATHGP